jgi:hypothetical protein
VKKEHLNFAASYILGTQNNGKWKFSEKIYRYFPVGETRAGSPTQFESMLNKNLLYPKKNEFFSNALIILESLKDTNFLNVRLSLKNDWRLF